MKFCPCLCIAFAAWFAGTSFAADASPVLAKARAYLGSEADLEAVRSVRYEGHLTSTETGVDGEARTLEAKIEILFQKPFQQRIVARAPDKVEITALDDYEGWQRVEDPHVEGAWRLNLLGKEQIKRLRANTWENLSFFRDLDRHGGEIEDHGRVELDDKPAHKIAFVHDEDIVFTRYFDPASGQLLLTETERGAHIREEGEIRASGVRFPKRIVTKTPLPNGGSRVVTVEFTSVTVNERFDADAFRVPSMGTRLVQ